MASTLASFVIVALIYFLATSSKSPSPTPPSEKKTNLMTRTNRDYRIDRKYEFRMQYVSMSNGTYTIYALISPHDPHGKGELETHLGTNKKICIGKGFEPRSLNAAMKIGSNWAESYAKYIRTGSYPKK